MAAWIDKDMKKPGLFQGEGKRKTDQESPKGRGIKGLIGAIATGGMTRQELDEAGVLMPKDAQDAEVAAMVNSPDSVQGLGATAMRRAEAVHRELNRDGQ